MTRKLVSKKELKSVYGVPYCFAHIARLEAAGKFPKRGTLGACRVAWVAEEVETWIDERIANRQTSFARKMRAYLAAHRGIRSEREHVLAAREAIAEATQLAAVRFDEEIEACTVGELVGLVLRLRLRDREM